MRKAGEEICGIWVVEDDDGQFQKPVFDGFEEGIIINNTWDTGEWEVIWRIPRRKLFVRLGFIDDEEFYDIREKKQTVEERVQYLKEQVDQMLWECKYLPKEELEFIVRQFKKQNPRRQLRETAIKLLVERMYVAGEVLPEFILRDFRAEQPARTISITTVELLSELIKRRKEELTIEDVRKWNIPMAVDECTAFALERDKL